MSVVPVQQTCYRHPGRETGVRCQRCERPICAECIVPAPVGVQCPECVRAAAANVRIRSAEPLGTYVLIGLNSAVWLIGLLLSVAAGGRFNLLGGGSALARFGGLYGPAVAAGEWWRIVTAGFLHAGLLHLAFNMAALYVFGPPLERGLGRTRFLALYVTSLLAGSFGALLLSPNALTVGASGAIFGLFGAVIAAQRAAGINLRSGGMIPLLVINLVFTLAVPGISIGGHLGGLAGGFLAGSLLYEARLRRSRGVSLVACLAFAVLLAAGCVAVSSWRAG